MIKNDSNTRKSGNKEYQIGLSRLIGGITMKGFIFEKMEKMAVKLGGYQGSLSTWGEIDLPESLRKELEEKAALERTEK